MVSVTTQKLSLLVSATQRPLRVFVEPWGREFNVAPDDSCDVTVEGAAVSLELDVGPDGLMLAIKGDASLQVTDSSGALLISEI